VTRIITIKSILLARLNTLLQNATKEYHRFATNQPVGLRHAGLILEVASVTQSGDSIEIHATCKKVGDAPKPKAFIHWVSNPMKIETRLYDRL
jgi:glutaminyl-tRNA synthetase